MFAGDSDQQILLRPVQFILYTEGPTAEGRQRGATSAGLQVLLLLQAEEVHLDHGNVTLSRSEPAVQAQTAAEGETVQVSASGGELMSAVRRALTPRRRLDRHI